MYHIIKKSVKSSRKSDFNFLFVDIYKRSNKIFILKFKHGMYHFLAYTC